MCDADDFRRQSLLARLRGRQSLCGCRSDLNDYLDDKEVMLQAVSLNEEAFRAASRALQDDKQVVMAAVGTFGRTLHHVSAAYKADKEVVLTALQNSCWAFYDAAPSLKADKEVVLAAVTTNGILLEVASQHLRADKRVVMAAVNSYGPALEYASKALCADKEVVMAALSDSAGYHVLQYASASLKADKEVVLAAVTQAGHSLSYASAALYGDKEVVMAAVNQDGDAMWRATAPLKADREVVLAAVTRSGYALRFASDTLRADKEVVVAAVSSEGCALQFVSEELKSDHDVLMAAAKNNACALKFASSQLLDCSIVDNLPFVRRLFRVLDRFKDSGGGRLETTTFLGFFPGLVHALSTLSRQLQACGRQGLPHLGYHNILTPDCMLGMTRAEDESSMKLYLVQYGRSEQLFRPHIVAERVLAAQRSVKQICRSASLSDDIEKRIRKYTGLPENDETATLLRTYSPIIEKLERIETHSWRLGTWWRRLRRIASPLEDDNF